MINNECRPSIVENESWLNSNQAANYLGISPNAIRIMVYRKQIPFYKFGKRLRFLKKDLTKVIKRSGV